MKRTDGLYLKMLTKRMEAISRRVSEGTVITPDDFVESDFKIVLFGAGDYGWKYFGELQRLGIDIAFFVDNNSKKTGSILCEKEVLSLKEALNRGGNLVWLLSVKAETIKKEIHLQLIKSGEHRIAESVEELLLRYVLKKYELKALQRTILIHGADWVTEENVRCLEQLGICISGICDDNPEMFGKRIGDLKVCSIEEIRKKYGEESVWLISKAPADENRIEQIAELLISYGFSNISKSVMGLLEALGEAEKLLFFHQYAVQSTVLWTKKELPTGKMLTEKYPIHPIKRIIVEEPVRRLNLVTDSIEKESLFGGVVTALIIASKLAVELNYELRIITRYHEPSPLNYTEVLRLNHIILPKKVTYYCDRERNANRLEVSGDDIFIATSWWSAMAIKETSIRRRFFYIIQEAETLFYSHGVEHYLCSQIMEDRNIDFIVNHRLLYSYFKENRRNIYENGVCFEPAFSKELYCAGDFKPKERYRLFFYARPQDPRNMYTLGRHLIQAAIARGILDTDRWEICFAGQYIGDKDKDCRIPADYMGQLTWNEYVSFIKDVDLAVSLMYTPHPGYTPYDVACSGGVVITNQYLNKTNLDECQNIIVSSLEEEEFLQSFEKGVLMAENMELRKKNYEESTILRDWNTALKDVIQFMSEMIREGEVGDENI